MGHARAFGVERREAVPALEVSDDPVTMTPAFVSGRVKFGAESHLAEIAFEDFVVNFNLVNIEFLLDF